MFGDTEFGSLEKVIKKAVWLESSISLWFCISLIADDVEHLSFLWLDKVAQLLVSFPTDAANGGGWGGVSLCGQRGNSIFTRIRPGPCQSWVCYIKLHSVFSVLLLELLFTETTQPTTLPWAHGELSYNCPHTAGCLELASSEPTGDVSSRTISHSSEISSHKES